jgi:type I restriction enzyme S subunit
MSKWPTVELASACREITVGYVSKMSDQYISSGIPFLRSQDVAPGYIRTDDLKFISPTFHQRLKKSQLGPGDVVIVRTGYPGTAAVVPETLPIANCADLVIVRAGKQLNPRFLAFTLNSPWGRGLINGRLVGVAQQHFNVRVAQALKVPLPPRVTQDRIASILGAYDDLIEINRQRIALLQEMARQLFEEWFVRFRFPGCESYATQEDNRPGRWKIKPLSSVAEFVRGRGYRTADLVEAGGLPFVNLKCFLRDGGFKEGGLKRYAGAYRTEQLLWRGDVVIAITDMTQERRIVGQAARIPNLGELPAVPSMDVMKVVPSTEISNDYLYHWLRFSDFSNKAAQRANGANVLHLSSSAISEFPIVVPDRDVQELFTQHVGRLNDQCDALHATEKRLSASRDLLLPPLISGELSIAAGERELEAVA